MIHIYCIPGTFEGENFLVEFHSFVGICESFLCDIWWHDVLWPGTSEQFAKVFSLESFPLYYAYHVMVI